MYRDGEPLLDKKLPQRIKYLKDGGVENIGIATNVSLLNEKRSEAMLNSGLDLIMLSIDSLNKEIFENIRIRLKLDEVVDNAINFLNLEIKLDQVVKYGLE